MVLKSINCLLADGTTTKIDLSFYTKFKKYNWYIGTDGYIMTKRPKNNKYCFLRLSHYVYNFDSNIDKLNVIDHKYRNTRDNRFKKLRKVSKSINSKNKKPRPSNTGFPGISYNYRDNCFSVRYTLDKKHYTKSFYITQENPDHVAFYEAFEFNENFKSSNKEYRLAYCMDENESSSGSSIDEIDYEHRINIERLNISNTSKYKHISHMRKKCYWIVNYYDEHGQKRRKKFSYNLIRKTDNEKEAELKAVIFRDDHEKYRPKYNKKNTINNNINDDDNNEGFLEIESDDYMKIIERKNINEIDSNIMNEDEIYKKI